MSFPLLTILNGSHGVTFYKWVIREGTPAGSSTEGLSGSLQSFELQIKLTFVTGFLDMLKMIFLS